MKLNRWGWQTPRLRLLDRVASFRERGEDLPPEEDPVGDYISKKGQQRGPELEPQPAVADSDAVTVVNLSAVDAGQAPPSEEAGEPFAAAPEPQPAVEDSDVVTVVNLSAVDADQAPQSEEAEEPSAVAPELEPAVEDSDVVTVVNLSAVDAVQAPQSEEAGEPRAVIPPAGMGEGAPAGPIVEREKAGVSAEQSFVPQYVDPDLGAERHLTDPLFNDEGNVDVKPAAEAADDTLTLAMGNTDPIRPYPPQGVDQPLDEDGDTDSLLDVFRTEKVNRNPISVLAQRLLDMNIYSLLDETIQVAAAVRGTPVEDFEIPQELPAGYDPALPGRDREETASALPETGLQEEVGMFSEPRLEAAPLLPESHLEGEALSLPEDGEPGGGT